MDQNNKAARRRRKALVRGLERRQVPFVRLGLAVVAAVSAASAIASMSTM
ncbi:hypothetical protein [Enterovirga sp. CN4-39]